jgi:hypothetical protein
MSSPTINPGSNGSGGSYPSLEEISNLIRSLINDTQSGLQGIPGEGQIWTDDNAVSPFVQPFLNSAIRQTYRELRNIGSATLLRDNVIISGLTPVNGPNGFAQPDPAVQVYLSYSGYFDGSTINNALQLPGDLLFPEEVFERQTGTNNTFTKMNQSESGMSSRPQQPTLATWEWRGDAIWFVGSTQMRDVRLRYFCSLPQFFSPTLDFSSTFVPVLDSADAIAYKAAVLYARMLGTPALPDLVAEAKEQMFQLKNEFVRRTQSRDYRRKPYGNYGNTDTNNWFSGWGGGGY